MAPYPWNWPTGGHESMVYVWITHSGTNCLCMQGSANQFEADGCFFMQEGIRPGATKTPENR